MMELSKRIEKILEDYNFSVCGEISKRDDEEYDIELETYSPEGEDVIVPLIYDGTEEGFIKEFRSYAEDFDAEEHAEMWIESRGKNGVPESIKDLLDDAEWIKSTLEKVADALEENETDNSIERKYSEEAKMFVNAIKEMANKPNNLDNFQSYLSQHFEVWLNKFANTPEGLACEMKNFAEMEIYSQ